MQIEIEQVERLRFDHGGPVRAASAVAGFGDGFLVVQDDATHAAWFIDGRATAVRRPSSRTGSPHPRAAST
jgi:hypothetical protein